MLWIRTIIDLVASRSCKNTMSDQDDTLLDEDLGDEEYDLGNDEEEALLADDYEIDRQNSYKGEEETDDVLDLGVTDALDDLEGDDENISYRNEGDSHNQTHCYNDERIVECHGGYYDHEEPQQHYEENIGHNEAMLTTSISTGDLREKLQKNNNSAQRDVVIIGNGQQQHHHHHHRHHHLHQPPMEDDDGEEARERKNRFQNERTIISPKMNNEIPDSLESVVTMEHMRPMMIRGRGRGRGVRGIRGGRCPVPMPNFNPRFSVRGLSYDEQKPQFRPQLLESRQPLFPSSQPNNMMNPQMMYHQGNVQHPPRFQQFQGGPLQHVPSHHFNDPSNALRPPFNQFPGMVQVSRMQNPRIEFRPRAIVGLRFNGPINSAPFMPPRPPHFQVRPQQQQQLQQQQPQHGSEVRPMPNNHESMIPVGPRGQSLLGPAPHSMVPHGPNNHIRPTHPGHPRMLAQGSSGLDSQIPPRFTRPGPAHIANHPNVSIGTQPQFENRQPFQESSQFERRNMYDPVQQQQQQQQQQPQQQPQQPPQPPQQYNNQSVNQFNNNMAPMGAQQLQGSTVPNVPIPPGHKILINPHFRGTPQTSTDGRSQWDGTQQSMPQSQVPSDQTFAQNASYRDSVGYNQTPITQQSSQEYQKSKNDDPYAYFSDVWQENKTSKPKSTSPLKSYSAESNYSRENSYRDYDSKYKSSDSRDTYQEDERYRDRTPPARSRDYSQRPRSHQSNSAYHNDAYEQRSNRSANNSSSNRGPSKPLQKRSPQPLNRSTREISPKRIKSSNRNLLHGPHGNESNVSSRNKPEDDLDPEMREYRKKMEEQKRLREKILQEKENRRKQAALEKFSDDSRDVKNLDNVQHDNKVTTVTTNVIKNDVESVSQSLAIRGRLRTGNAQPSEVNEKGSSGVRIVRKIPGGEKHTSNHTTKELISDVGQIDSGQSRTNNQQQQQQQSSTRRVVINTPSIQRVSTSIQKTVSNLQKNQSTSFNSSIASQKGINKPVTTSKNTGIIENTRAVVKDGVGSTAPQRKVVVNNALPMNSKKTAGNGNFQRIVLQSNAKPNTIVIENLATSTSETEIRRMCQGIGTLESILMGDKTATIVFKTHSAAAVFQKKYQRKMIDLSMINVRLLNQTVSIKRPTLL